MDKSFTSLIYMKGPSREECAQFVAKFKSAVVDNEESNAKEVESEIAVMDLDNEELSAKEGENVVMDLDNEELNAKEGENVVMDLEKAGRTKNQEKKTDENRRENQNEYQGESQNNQGFEKNQEKKHQKVDQNKNRNKNQEKNLKKNQEKKYGVVNQDRYENGNQNNNEPEENQENTDQNIDQEEKHLNKKSKNEDPTVNQNEEHKGNQKDEKKSEIDQLTGEEREDSSQQEFLAYRIRLDGEYVVTIRNKKAIKVFVDSKNNKELDKSHVEKIRSEDSKHSKVLNENNEKHNVALSYQSDEPIHNPFESSKTISTASKARNTQMKVLSSKSNYTENDLNESEDVKVFKQEIAHNVGSTDDNESMDTTGRERAIENVEETVKTMDAIIVDESSNQLVSVLTQPWEDDAEFIGTIRIRRNTEISIGKIRKKEDSNFLDTELKEVEAESLGELVSKNTKPIGTTWNIDGIDHEDEFSEISNQSSKMKSSQDSLRDEEIQRITSRLLKKICISTASLGAESDPFTAVKRELNELLQMASTTGINSESLFHVLCNILQEVQSIKPALRLADPGSEVTRLTASTASSQGVSDCSENIVLLLNNYYIVNIEQIKSMAAIMERIDRVVNTLLKYCIDIKSDTSDPANVDQGSAKTSSRDDERIPETLANDPSKDTPPDLGENKATATDHERKLTINVLEMSAPFATPQSSSSLPSVDPQSFPESRRTCLTSIRSNRDSSFSETSGPYTVHHLNSFGSRMSISDGELSFGEHPKTYNIPDCFKGKCELSVKSDQSGILLKQRMEHVLQVNTFPRDNLPRNNHQKNNPLKDIRKSYQKDNLSSNVQQRDTPSSTDSEPMTKQHREKLLRENSPRIGHQRDYIPRDNHQKENLRGNRLKRDQDSQTRDKFPMDVLRANEFPRDHLPKDCGQKDNSMKEGRRRNSGADCERLAKQRRFRSILSRAGDSVSSTDELIALLDQVERLLMLNCADRYEMMILLEQIFSEYARSAAKAVADLKKFIVTFNKNNSYL